MAFSIDSTQPPAAARPTSPASRGVIHPQGTARDGQGAPCGAVGPVEAEVGRSHMSAAGHAWWMAHFSAANDLSVTVSDLTVYDELYEQERTFSSAVMLRPTWSSHNPGTWYRDYRIRFTNLQE